MRPSSPPTRTSTRGATKRPGRCGAARRRWAGSTALDAGTSVVGGTTEGAGSMSLTKAGRGTAALAVVVGMGIGAQSAAADTGLSDKVARQIAGLQKLKRSLSPAERKLDSRLVVTL